MRTLAVSPLMLNSTFGLRRTSARTVSLLEVFVLVIVAVRCCAGAGGDVDRGVDAVDLAAIAMSAARCARHSWRSGAVLLHSP